MPVPFPAGDGDICAGTAVLHGVAEQLPQDKAQPLGVGQGLLHLQGKVKADALGDAPGLKVANFLVEHRPQLDRFYV
ncbi:hypothetical protein D3C75_1097660 [compost metagenome]